MPKDRLPRASMPSGARAAKERRKSRSRAGWGGAFVLGAVAALLLFYRIWWSPARARPVSAAEPPANVGSVDVPALAEPEPLLARVDFEAGPMPSTDADSANNEESSAVSCRRAPIRGCAPSKDASGCYHCLKCRHRFHFDSEEGPRGYTLTCREMPRGPIDVYLSDEQAKERGGARFRVDVTSGSAHFEQAVTASLGAAYFGELRGGNIVFSTSLEGCGSLGDRCKGDIDITVIAADIDPPGR